MSTEVKPQLTETQLAEIEARTNAATKGPWDWTYHPSQDGVIALVSTSRDEDVLLCTGNDSEAWGEISEHDASFLAHARADIPALIRDWRALRAENERLLSLVDSQAAGVATSLRSAVLGIQNPMGCWCKTPMVNISEGRDHEPRCQAVLAALREPDAATAMRGLCVEKAKEHGASEWLISELQSLTLDSREQIRNG